MNHRETLKILAVLRAAYPGFYAKMPPREAEGVAALWEELFAGEAYELVAAAVKALLCADERGFPPHIGAVKARVRQLTAPVQMTELEAWALVRRAIRGAYMEPSSRRISARGGIDPRTSAQRNFEALPPLLRRLVGGPEQLAAWERVPDDEIDTVIQSNFMRSYRARAGQQREYEALPPDVKALMGGLGQGLALEEAT